MIDLKRVRAVALDVAGVAASYERQEDVTEFIWHLLERHYRLYVFSSAPGEDLSGEDFDHPGLTFLREEMPPGQSLVTAHPELVTPETLWITDDAQMQRWIADHGLPFMHLERAKRGSAAKARTPAGGQHVPRLSELKTLLDPTGLLLDSLVGMVADARRFQPQGALLVGIGGPLLSGYQQFTLDLRMRLQSHGEALVELLDLTSLMLSSDALAQAGGTTAQPWQSAAAQTWLRDAVLAPLRAGKAVYAEALPPGLPPDFGAHFPLYLSEASVVLIFGELVFLPEVREALHVSVLLETTPEETTRRLFEIEPGEPFDSKFTEQYLKREGRVYQDYLKRHRVAQQVSLRIDANRQGAFVPAEEAPPLLV